MQLQMDPRDCPFLGLYHLFYLMYLAIPYGWLDMLLFSEHDHSNMENSH